MSWLDIFNLLWSVASTLTPVILLAGFTWLRTKFVSVDCFAKLEEDFRTMRVAQAKTDETMRIAQARIEETISSIRGDMDASPTRAELAADMNQIAERMSAVEAGIKGVSGQLGTTNQYLHTLIEKGLSR